MPRLISQGDVPALSHDQEPAPAVQSVASKRALANRTGRAATTRNPVSWVAEEAVPTEAQIAARAYELFERRGREHGHDEGDWLRAEQELRAELVGAKPRRTRPNKE